MSKSYDIERTSQGFTIDESSEIIEDMVWLLREAQEICWRDGATGLAEDIREILARIDGKDLTS